MFLTAEERFMPEMHLKEPGFTYSACGPFTKNKGRIQKFLQTENTSYIYRTDLDKACLQYDMGPDSYKDLTKKTESDKVLKDKSFKIANNPKCGAYGGGLASMVYRVFDKKSPSSSIKSVSNQQLADELCKPITKGSWFSWNATNKQVQQMN